MDATVANRIRARPGTALELPTAGAKVPDRGEPRAICDRRYGPTTPTEIRSPAWLNTP